MTQPHHDDNLNYGDYVDGLRSTNARLLAALKDLLGDRPDVQDSRCIRCGRYYRGDIESGDCPSDDCPAYAARSAIAAAEGNTDAAPTMLRALKSARATIDALQADVDSFREKTVDPATYDVGEAEYNTLETVTAIDEAIAQATGRALSPRSANSITIRIEDGLVQDVTGIPAGYELRVEDHDWNDTSHPAWDAEKECFITVYDGGAA